METMLVNSHPGMHTAVTNVMTIQLCEKYMTQSLKVSRAKSLRR